MGPGGVPGGSGPGNTRGFYNADRTPVMIRNDYAANCGTYMGHLTYFSYINTTYDTVDDSLFPPVNQWTGISFARSEVNQADVVDGTTKTYMIGEKYLNPDFYDEFCIQTRIITTCRLLEEMGCHEEIQRLLDDRPALERLVLHS